MNTQLLLNTSLILVIFLAAFFVLYTVLSYLRIKKQRKHFEDLHSRLTEGQKVSLNNGIFGTIHHLGKETADIEIKSGAIMTVSRFIISNILEEPADANKSIKRRADEDNKEESPIDSSK